MCNLINFTKHSLEELSQTGVYLIQNKINNKMYIGSTRCFSPTLSRSGFYARWCKHINSLTKGEHHSVYLQRSWNKYGADNFKFSILHPCSPDKVLEIEQLYIDLLEPQYNSYLVAGSPKGFIVSEETRKKLSEAFSGEKHPLYGTKMSEETKKKIRDAQLGEKGNFYGKTHSKEIKRFLSEINTGEKHPMYGKNHSEESRLKMSITRSRHYKFTNPENEVVEIFNLRKFCLENSLHPGCMYRVNDGKASQHKGWKKYSEQN